MSNKIYRYLLYFAVFSFIGWVFETGAVFFATGDITSRGYFFIGPRLLLAFKDHSLKPLEAFSFWGLPAIEMYGIGGILIISLCDRYKKSFWKVFLSSAFFMTVFELLGSYWCTGILHRAYWDYSKEFMNFHGRICLKSSIAWGILGVLVIYFFLPWLNMMDAKHNKKKYYHLFLTIFSILMVICALIKYVFYQNIIPN